MPHVLSPLQLDVDRSGLLIIDLQKKLVPAVPSGKAVIRQSERLLKAAELLSVPFAATVQYPKGLGPLVPRLKDWIPDPEEKLDFSAAVCRGALDAWCIEGRDQIVIAGIETHICVQQTVLDLIAEGLTPHVVAEAVASRDGHDHEVAMQRMHDAGATITTVESVLFQWLRSAEHPEFKSISQLVKEG